mmetsp:Transcript_107499/g.213479  ORF Transcript_107499/g.213479 Transcript_107499/m.213479 type:complete len:324 (+) Transcript_107499:94-1065(+)|eukprot:CAMPEP_0172667366 /NCGR_PEP_ID=MMETSP1074-20121228/8376_1 /TAXON_ID=2916 /ORGANISM="Ceratium fusus, Strain PA161109" /LENGTH=323 /DNA_ID=CAMNT_0013483857 /DNA_START=67 /DNA_END=1038 /DNA_ORIENTATION=+
MAAATASAEAADQSENQQREDQEESLRRLEEATGATPDACLAALLASGGCVDEAAEHLLLPSDEADNVSHTENDQRDGPEGNSAETVQAAGSGAVIDEELLGEQVVRLAEATGRSVQQCRETLVARGNDIEAAVDDLLGQATDRALSSNAEAEPHGGNVDQEDLEPGTDADDSPDPGEAMMADHVARVTGRSLTECRRALEACGGLADTAVLSLLGAGVPEADDHPGSAVDRAEAVLAAEVAADSDSDIGSSPASPEAATGIADLLGPGHDDIADLYAGVRATEVNADELLRWQRRRSATETAPSSVDTGVEGNTSPAKRHRS